MRNHFYYVTGIGFLILANLKYRLKGYATPKPFSNTEIERCIDYDIRVVDEWLSYLETYTGVPGFLSCKNVLELGPGSDLGIGLYLLSLGAARYHAFDVNDLEKSMPSEFYQRLFERLCAMRPDCGMDYLQDQLVQARRRHPANLNYCVRSDFDLTAALEPDSIDLVFSQAAFEHFDDIERTAARLSAVCRPGAALIAEIDLKTHSRWIREKDPNNIYRYSSRVYNLLKKPGFPNRLRPIHYQQAFERHGWKDIAIIPLETEINPTQAAYGHCPEFRDEINQMDLLSIMFCARKI